jgi:hypothetical protein
MPNLTDTDDARSARILSSFLGGSPADDEMGTVLPLRPLARAIRNEIPSAKESR